MSLRILLADESSNIKKAFQLALAELGADIKSVPSGLDVHSVTTQFKPHIVFADVLLTKKSGYEVCKEIKTDPALQNTPVILMWSNFMEFNESQAKNAGYDDRLEKPFDTAALKQLVQKYYSQANQHPLKDLVEQPKLDAFRDDFKPVALKPAPPVQQQQPKSAYQEPPRQTTTSSFEPEELFEVDEDFTGSEFSKSDVELTTENYGDFEEVVLVKSNHARTPQQTQFKNQVSSNPASQSTRQAADQMTDKISKQIKTYIDQSPLGLTANSSQGSSKLDHYQEQLFREEARIMAEKICWQVIPDIAEKIIREEISNLMKSIDKSI